MENVETPWAETKKLGGSVKHENHGTRHDSLDAAMHDWNYMKYINLRTFFVMLWRVGWLTSFASSGRLSGQLS